MRLARRPLVVVALAGVLPGGLWLARTPPVEPAAARVEAPARPALPNLRVAVEDLARRQGAQLVLADAVAADLLAMPAPVDGADAAAPEASLRRWLNGFELVLHYSGDDGSGRARLKAAWVFPLGKAGVLQAVAAPDARPVVSAASGGLQDNAGPARPQVLQPERQGDAAPSLQDLRTQVDADPSEAARIEALEAFVAHPEAGDAEVRALLEQASHAGTGLLAEHARALRESREAPVAPLPVPELTEAGI